MSLKKIQLSNNSKVLPCSISTSDNPHVSIYSSTVCIYFYRETNNSFSLLCFLSYSITERNCKQHSVHSYFTFQSIGFRIQLHRIQKEK